MPATLLEAEPARPGFVQRPRAPRIGARRGVELRASFRARVLASAGAL